MQTTTRHAQPLAPSTLDPKTGDIILYVGDKIPRPRTVRAVPGTIVSVIDEALTFQMPNGRLFGVLAADCKVVKRPQPEGLNLVPIESRTFRYGPK